VGSGDTVALLLRNDVELFEAVMASSALGASPVPINWHGSAEEVAYVLTDSRARVLVGHADLLRGVAAAVPASVHVLGVRTPADIARGYGVSADESMLADGVTEWGPWRDGFAPGDADVSADAGTILYTSGTTGHPKGVRRIPGTRGETDAGAYTMDVLRYFGLWPTMRTVIAGPMYHSAPYAYAMAAARYGADLIVLQDRFDAEGLLALVERHRIDSLYLVPTMFVRLLRLGDDVRARYDLSSLRQVSHTAAPCPPAVKRALIEWLGPIVTEFYGSTEVGLVTGCDSAEWLAHPGSVGHRLASCEVRVLTDEGEAGVGEVGQVFVRAHAASDFTYEGRADDRAAIERDGLVTCGDVGYFDADGYLYLCDRVRDMIISGGVNIYPVEVEACLLTLAGVADVAVFGVPDDEFGESVAAAVQLDAGATLSAEDVRAHVRAHLAHFKAPKVVAFHDELPREDTGKIFKRKLRAPYWEGAGRTI
ncbi:MAG: AMP-binding protein, partial [Acidimicrobiales bacterium]